MTDRKTVMKAIRCCLIPGNGGCDECPFGKERMCQTQLGVAVLNLLEKQEDHPKRQREQAKMMRCVCGALLVYRGRDVCPNCGRAVKWND